MFKMSLTKRYIPAVALIALFVIITHLLNTQTINSNKEYAKIINISGEQRMLSQRLIILGMEYTSTHTKESKYKLLNTIVKLEENHKYLLTKKLTKKITHIYEIENLNSELNNYILNFKKLISTDETTYLETATKNSYKLLLKLNSIVQEYEIYASSQLEKMSEYEAYLTLLTLFVIVVEILLIFRPTAIQIEQNKKLIEEKEEYESAVIESNNNAIIAIDWTSKITTYNKKAEELFGWSKDEMLGKRYLLNIVPPKYKSAHEEASKKYLNSGVSCGVLGRGHELEAIKKDGTIFPIYITFGNVEYKPQNAIVIASMYDLTDKKNSENELTDLNENLEEKVKVQTLELMNNLDIMSQHIIYSKTDVHGIITEVSKAFCEISGYTEGELIGKSHNILRHPDMPASIFKGLWKSIKSNKEWNGEVKNLKKDGSYYWVNASILPEFNNEAELKGYVAIRQDITAQKDHEQQTLKLIESEKMASMGEMIGNIAHQWRQPLNAISMTATNLQMDIVMDDVNRDEFAKELELIGSYAQHLSQTIDIFRDFIKGEKKYKELVIQDEIKQALSISSSTLSNAQITLIDNIDYKNDIKLTMTSGELPQVIINIITNAMDALLDNNILNAKIEINLIKIDNRAVITIEDNAGGIPESILPKIFEPYFTTKHKNDGTGLGLHMSYQIINNSLNGKLYALNTSKGAKFVIELDLDN
ncbi:MAG: PAS domain S-box protein [Helicobacteraceae bacterium]|nr:PAS domain S-box protein [Helicobacteraceae bacterium]